MNSTGSTEIYYPLMSRRRGGSELRVCIIPPQENVQNRRKMSMATTEIRTDNTASGGAGSRRNTLCNTPIDLISKSQRRSPIIPNERKSSLNTVKRNNRLQTSSAGSLQCREFGGSFQEYRRCSSYDKVSYKT